MESIDRVSGGDGEGVEPVALGWLTEVIVARCSVLVWWVWRSVRRLAIRDQFFREKVGTTKINIAQNSKTVKTCL